MVYLRQVSISPMSFLDDAIKTSEDKKTEYWGYPDIFKKYSQVFEFFFKERYQRIVEHNPPSGHWLDIGSGFGLWQSQLKKLGIDSFGIEIEPNACQYSQSIGLNVEQISIEEFNTDLKFAVITICDVLEHVEDPTAILKKCQDLLLDNGLLYIQVPNVLGLKIPFGDQLGLPHHLWQFSPKPLLKLGEKSGFKILNYWTGIQGVIRYYESGGPYFYHKFFWAVAKQWKLGNRLQILMRK